MKGVAKPGDGILHLAASLFLGRDPSRCHMVWITGWYDASGVENNGPVIAVAGILGSVEAWGTFAERWATVLNDFSLAEFHGRKLSYFRRNDPEGYLALRRALAETVTQDFHAFVAMVPIPVYSEIDRRYPLSQRVGGPYGLAQFVTVAESVRVLLKVLLVSIGRYT